MRRLACFVLLLSTTPLAVASPAADFDAAVAKWRAAGVRNYTFTYKWEGGVIFAPKCADALIRVRVRNRVSASPVVVRGNRRCPKGIRGAKTIGFGVPATIDDAFEEMRRYIFEPPTKVRVTASYDAAYGIPLSYYVEKLELTDNDEGFKIGDFEVAR